MNLTSDKERIISDDFQKEVERNKTIIFFWKNWYNYSATDPRFTNATMEEIFQDCIDIKVRDYIEKFETYDKGLNELAKKLVLDPNKTAIDEREKIANEINSILGIKK